MFTRCLVCQAPFPRNETLEHFPTGDRIAFDPARGRLWAVCRTCRRWSLAPIEDRWEALEELEKLVRDRSRLLSQTDNVALFRAGELELVRVGRANRAEESWWRYGRELTTRRQTYKKIKVTGSVAAGAAIVGGWATGGIGLVGMWLLLSNTPEAFTGAARWLRFGSNAWRGARRCERCGYVFSNLRYRERGGILLEPGQDPGHPDLLLRCPECGHQEGAGLRLQGRDAERTLRRVLAYHHHAGASEERVRGATALIEQLGSPQELTRIVVQDGKRLGDLRRTGAIALEIAANEAAEQRLLELELAEIEHQWRVEEELAAIVDGELTPLPLLEQLRLKATGRS